MAAAASFTLIFATATTSVALSAMPSAASNSNELISEQDPVSYDVRLLLALNSDIDGGTPVLTKEEAGGVDLGTQDPAEPVVAIIALDESLASAQQNSVVASVVAEVKKEAKKRGLTNQQINAIEVVQTYENAFHGVAIKLPRFTQDVASRIQGVTTAFVEQRYEVPESIPSVPVKASANGLKNESSLMMTGADQSAAQGDGTLISIIDTGLDTGHEGFVDNLDPKELRYTKSQIDAIRSKLGEGKTGTYVSNKVPFTYDYADGDNNVNPTPGANLSHGTHVAGMAAANGGEEVRGTAPNAQVMVQKVFSDTQPYAYDSWILAALDDAATIKPDVIKMSLGSSAGFSDASTSLYGYIFEQLRAQGIVLSVSAGNSRQAAVNNASGANLPFATDPDYGIVGSPSTYGPNLSVASINNALTRPYMLGMNNAKTYYKAITSADGSGASFSELQEGTYSYVVAGLGSADDIAAASMAVEPEQRANTILIINRGGFTFQEKINNAKAFRPAAVLIADNVDSADFLNPQIDDSPFPVAVVTKVAEQALTDASEKTLTIASDFIDAPDQNYRASVFSSMGVTPSSAMRVHR